MPHQNKTIIIKFGGKSIPDLPAFDTICKIIISHVSSYTHVGVVISAMLDVTDSLHRLGEYVNSARPKREMDMLLSAGERISMALLAMALQKRGYAALSLTGSQAGIVTSTVHGEAAIKGVYPYRIEEAFKRGMIPIVAGFQGVSTEKEITTLGRGGSDTTAVALAIAVNAEKVIFYKDVDGIYSAFPEGRKSDSLTYGEALSIIAKTGNKVIHPRAVQLAQKNTIPLEVVSFYAPDEGGTIIQESEERKREAMYEFA